MELEFASDAVVAVGIGVELRADSVGSGSSEDWSTVCPLIGVDKPKVADAASIAAKNGDKRMSLRSFSTSTHHVNCELAINCSFVVHFPLSAASFDD
jgi:hypothetical protein